MNVSESYQTLELDFGVSLDEIEATYKRLIRVWHPDRFAKSPDLHAHAEEKTKRLNAAREVLRAAWSTGKLIDDSRGGNGTPADQDGYADHSVWYYGFDPRIRPFGWLESNRRSAAVSVTGPGLVLATIVKSDVDEVVNYPVGTIRWLIGPDSKIYLMPTASRLPQVTNQTVRDVYLAADDPEGLVSGIRLNIQFRNEYFANLFVKRAVSILGLEDTSRLEREQLERETHRKQEQDTQRKEELRKEQIRKAEELAAIERRRLEHVRQQTELARQKTELARQKTELARQRTQARAKAFRKYGPMMAYVLLGIFVCGIAAGAASYYKKAQLEQIKIQNAERDRLAADKLLKDRQARQVKIQNETRDRLAADKLLADQQAKQAEILNAEQKLLAAKFLEDRHAAAVAKLLKDLHLGDVTTNSLGMKLVEIPAGEFLMGSTDADLNKAARFDAFFQKKSNVSDDEKPQHWVQITQGYYMGQCEVTRGQFKKFVEATGYQTEAETDGKGGMGYNPQTESNEQHPKFSWRETGFVQTDDHPVVNVSWNDALKFCEWLSQQERKKYTLPTEAQWEFAARVGTRTLYVTGDQPNTLEGSANVKDQSFLRNYSKSVNQIFEFDDHHPFTSPVGIFASNKFGLHDMHGNVWEWCQDRYGERYYDTSPERDPVGTPFGNYRVLRGGSWNDGPQGIRSANRYGKAPDFRANGTGFRVSRTK